MSGVPSTTPDSERQVGSYVLVRPLGRGAMGEVWLGRHTISGGLAAVKLLRVGGRDPARLGRFLAREGRAVARLAHPHIVPVFELGPEHMATGLVEGTDLARRLHTPIEPSLALRITRQIASALAHAHARGVVHRDVKPSNILLDQHGDAHLADFGLATIAGDADPELSAVRAGTPGFMAPELAEGKRAGPAADQYALGRTLLEMLLGGHPPGNPDQAIAALPESLPAALRRVVVRAMARAPGERFASLDDFEAALAAVAADASALPAPERLAPEARLRAGYAWAASPVAEERLAPDLARADYRLTALEAAGVVDAAAARALRERHGLAEIGFSVYGRTSRLGPLADAGAAARASEVAVLLHGLAHNRHVWRQVATAICRDDGQALVVTVDVFGFGESRFAGTPSVEHADVTRLVRWLGELLGLLGLAELPTVLVGHSIAGLALIAAGKSDLGARIARVAINPVLPWLDDVLRAQFVRDARALRLVGWFRPLLVAGTRRSFLNSPQLKNVSAAAKEVVLTESLGIAPRTFARLLEALGRARPGRAESTHLMVMACADDPLVRFDHVTRAAAEIRLSPASLRILASGGHLPHMEDERHPEHTARNVAEIVHLVGTMLLTARQGTMSSTQLESTMMDTSGAASRPSGSDAA